MLLGLYEALACDVRFGSKADIAPRPLHVRFTPKLTPTTELLALSPPLRRLVDRGLMTARFFGPQQILKAARRRKPDLDFPVGVLSIARWARSRAL
jgi:hypothetical protein